MPGNHVILGGGGFIAVHYNRVISVHPAGTRMSLTRIFDPGLFPQHHGKEHSMKNLTIIAAIAATLGAGGAYADHHGERRGEHADKLEAAFKADDTDGDGSLDKEEAKAMPRVAKNFDKLDADKDGTVDIPHWGVSFRAVFGAAAANHDITNNGRHVKVTLNGVYIGTIQLADGKEKAKRERLHQGSA